MPVYRLFRHLPFEPERVDLMSSVLELVSLELGLTQREDPLRDLVAKAIIECAQKGHFSREEMHRCAHQALQTT